MSWAADGKPRFVVTALRAGSRITTPPTRRGYGAAMTEFYVVDRAYCYQVVGRFQHPQQKHVAHNRAKALCKALNAEHDDEAAA